MKKCPICERTKLNKIVERKNFPISQSRYFSDEQSARNIPLRDASQYICENCGFVFNPQFDESLEIYDELNCSERSESKVIRDYLNDIVKSLSDIWDTNWKRCVEIGCGKEATFLKLLAEKFPNVKFVGYDPVADASKEENLEIVSRVFDTKEFVTDVVLSRHVIEHMSNPNLLLDIHKCLSRGGIEYIETPDVEWNFDHFAWFNWSYEHCSNFSCATFFKAANLLDFTIAELGHSFRDEYLSIYISNMKSGLTIDVASDIERLNLKAEQYRIKEKKIFEKIQEKMSKFDDWAIWGMAGKGSITVQLLDKEKKIFRKCIDIDPYKQGKYISGTGHKIESPETLKKSGVGHLLIMNDIYRAEIEDELKRMGLHRIKVVSIDDL